MKNKLLQIVTSVACLIMTGCTTFNIHTEKNSTVRFPIHLDASEWELSWQDEFSGEKLNGKKWKPCPEWKRQGGFCKWSNKNYRLNGKGQLELVMDRRDGKIYCGALRTQGKYHQKFGYFEVRCKVPIINGGWTAFWMMPVQQNKVGDEGRDATEIDIYESIWGYKGEVNHALHWDGYKEHLKSDAKHFKNRYDLYDGKYHKFACLWNEKEYIFYIDDKETWRTSSGGVMQTPGYMKLTMEAADKWAGDIKQQKLPVVWEIDYVRAYQPLAEKIEEKDD